MCFRNGKGSVSVNRQELNGITNFENGEPGFAPLRKGLEVCFADLKPYLGLVYFRIRDPARRSALVAIKYIGANLCGGFHG